ncbi:MAG: DUF2321 domain-containing protein [Nanoarchaeota archaeon]|nr:DUF2321 domain-containing protein [Nanoarchaeota archaeon]
MINWEEDFYDVMQVCKNGHQITDSYNEYPKYRKDFCSECGEETIFKCPNCNSDIKGRHHVSGVISMYNTPVPKHCENCGNKYPWAKKEELISNSMKEEINSAEVLVENICNKFHLVVKQIRCRYNERNSIEINDEYDVQDLFHALLKLHFDDIREEEWTPSYAGSGSRVDFLLKKEKIIIEIKKTRMNLKDKHLGEQLIIDTERYKSHPDCKTLICFVYDPEGFINKARSIENDLSGKKEDLLVKTIIVPKGY